MDRYSDYARDCREIPNVELFSSRATTLPLREFPQKCDPRRMRSYQKNRDIELSRQERPLLEIPTEPYKLRRIVVPPARSQFIEPSRIPNARDPRGLRACRKFNAKSKKWKYTPNWVPTLVENELVLQEEETCAVLVIDVSEWESKGIKRSYIELIPHECNVQRSLVEVERQLLELVEGARPDELLMTPEEAREAEQNMQPSARDDLDIEECDSDGGLLPTETSGVFDVVEDRPMLEINEEPTLGPVVNQKVPTPRRTDDDDDEDHVIYEADREQEEPPMPRLDDDDVECISIDVEESIKKEPQVAPTPRLDDADVECVDLESDEEEPIVRKQEPQEPSPLPPVPRSDDADIECVVLDSDAEEPVAPKKEPPPHEAHVPFDKNLPREVLEEVTISDSEDEEWDLMRVAMQLSREESMASRSKSDNSPSTCSGAVSLCPTDPKSDFSETGTRINESVQQVTAANHRGSSDCCVGESPDVTLSETGRCILRDCDSDPTTVETVISESRPVEKYYEDGESRPVEKDYEDGDARVEQTEESVGFGTETSETSYIADKARGGRSSDSDSDMPTTPTQFETVADVHEMPIRDKADDLTAHSEISQMQEEENEEVANITLAANFAQKRKRIDSERLDITDENEQLHALAIAAVEKRRKENNDDAANDENQSDNCKALVERAASPVFKAKPRRRNKRAKKRPSENGLQLSTTSTSVIGKPYARTQQRSIVFSNFDAIGFLNDYLKNYTATYNCLNFFSNNFEKLSVFEFLRINEYVKRNNHFWRDRYNHWHKEDNNVSIEEVTKENTVNQLAIEPAHTFTNGQSASTYNVQPREHKTVIEESVTALQSELSYSTRTDAITVTGDSWLVRGNSEEDIGKVTLQRRHSLPMITISQQNFGAKRHRSASNDNPIKLTLRRSQADDNKWIATANTSTKSKDLISKSNNIPDKHIDSVTNNASVSENKAPQRHLPKWAMINKEVPELEMDDFVNRPLPQKIQFDKNKLCISLQNRVKKRTTSVDSAIISDIDDNVSSISSKRRKLTDSTKEYELTMDNFFNYYNDEPLEITELPPDSCVELPRPLSSFEIFPKDCPSNTFTSDEECFDLNEKNLPCLENINQDFQDDSSDSNSNFHLHMNDELDDSSNTAQTEASNIEIDHNCNLQKDLDSFDEPCSKTLNAAPNEINLNEDLEKHTNFNFNGRYIKKVDKLNKKMEDLFGKSDIDEVEKIVAKKYNYNKNQSDEMHTQKDGQTNNSMETRLQSIEEKYTTTNSVEQSCFKDSKSSAPNATELELMTTITNNEEQQQQIFGGEEATTENTHEKVNHIGIPLSNKKESALEITSSENQDEIITCKSSISLNLQSNSLKNVDYHEDCLDVQISQALINNGKQNQVESKNALESESNLSEDNQNSVILNVKVDSNVSHCNIKEDVTSKQVSRDERDEHLADDTTNVSNAEHPSSKDAEMVEYEELQESGADSSGNKEINNGKAENPLSKYEKMVEYEKYRENNESSSVNQETNDANAEHPPLKEKEMVEYENHKKIGKDSSENQEMNDINASTSSFYQDQGHPEIIDLEDGLEEGDLDFHISIHGTNTHFKYSDDDYDILSDDEECGNKVSEEYSKDVDVQKSNGSLVPNESTDASNCVSNMLEKDKQSSIIKTERVLAVSEDRHLQNSQESSLKSVNNDATTLDLNHSMDVDEEDDDITIEYENINNDTHHPKDVKPDVSNINNDSNVQINETSEVHVSNADIALGSQSTVLKVVSTALPSESSSQDKDSSIEPVPSQIETFNETMDSSDKSEVGIPAPDAIFLFSSTLNNSTITPPITEVSVSNECNDHVPNASTSVTSTLAVEPTIQPSANVDIDFNDPKVLEKFNLTREIIASEDIKAENAVAFENNDEEQTLCNTLENMLKDVSGKECDASEVSNEQNDPSNGMPSISALVNGVSVPTGPQSRTNDDLLKALNVNMIDEVDVIVDRTVDKNPAKHASPGCIKVKNLNDMLKKVPNPSLENAIPGTNVFPANSLPNIPQNTVYSVKVFQEQSGFPVNVFPLNNPLPNTYIIQPPPPMPYVTVPYIANPYIAIPGPSMNNVRQQVHFPNTDLVNQVQMQNNVQIPVPASAVAATSNNVVWASTMFAGWCDTQTTTAFCSKTVFSLPLPPLPNVILPPPYTILPSDDKPSITEKIKKYKNQLLDKIKNTLLLLEHMDINTILRQIDALEHRKTLTEETWNIQDKILILAQCAGSFKKLSADKNYSNIIGAIMGSIHESVSDKKLFTKIFAIFLNMKKTGIFKSFADEQEPLTSELGVELEQTPIGMSSAQKEILKYQIRIYREMLKINHNHIQSNGVAQSNIQTKNQNPVQRSSPMALQQNIVTTTVSSPVTDIPSNSFQNPVNIQPVQPVSMENLPGTTKKQRMEMESNTFPKKMVIHSKAL